MINKILFSAVVVAFLVGGTPAPVAAYGGGPVVVPPIFPFCHTITIPIINKPVLFCKNNATSTPTITPPLKDRIKELLQAIRERNGRS